MEKAGIFIVDDSRIHIEGLKLILSDFDFVKLTGEALKTENVIDNPGLEYSDIVFLDVALREDEDGIDLIEPILTRYPHMRIVMLSHSKDAHSIIRSVRDGAMAYIAKDTSAEELKAVIRVVMQGNGLYLGETIPKSVLANCFSTSEKKGNNIKPWNLSGRETEIIELISKGHLSKEIADLLCINVSTVESHKENIKKKLNLNTNVEIVVFAMRNGIISMN